MNLCTPQVLRLSLLLPLLLSLLVACGGGDDAPPATPTPTPTPTPAPPPPEPIVVVSYNFEGSTDGWSIDGLWHVSDVRASKDLESMRYADPATGDFDTGGSNTGSMISPAIDLGDFPVLPSMPFWTMNASLGLHFVFMIL